MVGSHEKFDTSPEATWPPPTFLTSHLGMFGLGVRTELNRSAVAHKTLPANQTGDATSIGGSLRSGSLALLLLRVRSLGSVGELGC